MGILFEFDFDPKQFPSAVIAYFVLNRFIPVRNANLFVSTHACVCAGEQNSYLWVLSRAWIIQIKINSLLVCSKHKQQAWRRKDVGQKTWKTNKYGRA